MNRFLLSRSHGSASRPCRIMFCYRSAGIILQIALKQAFFKSFALRSWPC
jgi:hypothetical protein